MILNTSEMILKSCDVIFLPHRSSSLLCVKQYMAVESGGYLRANRLLRVIAMWLNVHRTCFVVCLNTITFNTITFNLLTFIASSKAVLRFTIFYVSFQRILFQSRSTVASVKCRRLAAVRKVQAESCRTDTTGMAPTCHS